MAIAEALEELGVENTKAIEIAEKIIGGISQIVGFGSAVGKFLGFIGLLSDPLDGINKKLDDIARRIEGLENTVYDVARVQIDILRMIAISDQMGPVTTVLDIANDYVEEQSERNKERLENALQNAQTAINTMVDDPINNGYFKRMYHQELVYQQWDSEGLKPPNISSGQVWNYQYVLPFILKAIAVYLTASGIAEPTIEKYRRRYGGEIRTWAESLQQIHDEITNQIISIRPPKLYEFCLPNEAYAVPINSEGGIIGGGSEYGPNIRIPYLRYFCDRQGYLEEGKWNQVGRIYGAVEVRSAVAVEKFWPAIECPQPIVLRHPFFQEGYEPGTYELVHPFPPPEQWLRDIYAKHVIATLKATKDLYLYLGLLSLWRIIGKLRAIAGLNVIPPHPMSYWSLRQVDNVVGLAKLGRPSTASTGNRISVRTIADALGVAPPFSLRNSVLAQP